MKKFETCYLFLDTIYLKWYQKLWLKIYYIYIEMRYHSYEGYKKNIERMIREGNYKPNADD